MSAIISACGLYRYRLEQAVRELKEGNLVPLPPAWLNQEEDNG